MTRHLSHPVAVKTLLLMRHAKSAWDDPSLADHDRPLASRGRRAAPRIAAWLREQDLVPAHVRCSSAVRTRETLELLRPALRNTHVEINEDLYLATADGLLELVRTLPDTASSALLIGHNPGMQRLVVLLAARSQARRRVEAKFPTAALAVLELPVEQWSETTPGIGELVAYVTPNDLA
jgi:phosphohistidine phosphatase